MIMAGYFIGSSRLRACAFGDDLILKPAGQTYNARLLFIGFQELLPSFQVGSGLLILQLE
jgi:hypothetical protein